jgi:YD repeat-containing protein
LIRENGVGEWGNLFSFLNRFAPSPTEALGFAYDAAANLLDGPQAGAGLVVHNKLLTYQDKRYRYDAFGRMIEKRSAARSLQRFAYDAEYGRASKCALLPQRPEWIA